MADRPSAYEAVALKILPVGSHPSAVVRLRGLIAAAMAEEVNKALGRQREKEFPELASVRLELETQRKRLEHTQKDLGDREISLGMREAALTQQEQRLAFLLKAFEAYASWLDGEGEVDENGKRFNALREAYRQFKGGK